MIQKLKILMMCCLTLMIFALPGTSQAKNSTVQGMSSTVMQDGSGKDYLHVEIETNREAEAVSANINPNMPYQVIFRISDSRISHIAREVNLDNKLGDKIFIQEISGTVQGKIYLNREISTTNDNIKTYKINRKNSQFKYDDGVAIDIYPAEAKSPSLYGSDKGTAVSGLKGKIITIDPGHGGSDSGAVGPSGYTEKEATLAISQDLASILRKSGADVIMTRDTDVDVYGPHASATNELQARVDVGNNAHSDIFVSIHCNAFSSPAAHGTQTFYYGGSANGTRLARNIQQEMILTNGLYDRGISTCNFYVVKHSYMPAVLIETAFITNYNEEELLSDPQWQLELAQAIARGISDYFN